MITAAQLEHTGTKSRLIVARSKGQACRDPNTVVSSVWTNEMVNASVKSDDQEQLIKCGLTAISDGKAFFFSDDYIFGTGVLPKEFCHGLHPFPCKVMERAAVPDGVVDTAEKFIAVFFHDQVQIKTIEELVQYVNDEYMS